MLQVIGFTPSLELFGCSEGLGCLGHAVSFRWFIRKLNKRKLHGTKAWWKHSPFLVTHSCLCPALVLSPISAPHSLTLFCVSCVTHLHTTPQLQTRAVPNSPTPASPSLLAVSAGHHKGGHHTPTHPASAFKTSCRT